MGTFDRAARLARRTKGSSRDQEEAGLGRKSPVKIN